MPRGYAPLRQTAFDLYLERERLPWYHRPFATVSSWLVLAGYVLFALIFTSREDNLKASRAILIGLAGGCLINGYSVICIVAWLSRSLLFCYDCVLMPALTSSFLGLFITVMNHALHREFPISTDAYIYIPLITAGITTITSWVLLFVVHRRLRSIKATDNRRRISGMGHYTGRESYGDASTELIPSLQMPQDEAQRRQLLKLLLQRESGRSPSPDGSSTYRIDLPPALSGNEGQQYLAVPLTETRSRSDSQSSVGSRWNPANLMANGRDRSNTADSFKGPRERRREEIERGQDGAVASTPGLASPRAADTWQSPTPHSLLTPPAWVSTRYA